LKHELHVIVHEHDLRERIYELHVHFHRRPNV